MTIWLVGSGIPRRTSCASYAVPMNWLPKARPGRRSSPSWDVFRGHTVQLAPCLRRDATDVAKELKELREQNARLKRLLAEAELDSDALREVAKGKF